MAADDANGGDASLRVFVKVTKPFGLIRNNVRVQSGCYAQRLGDVRLRG